jgi:nucleotide-binding universal stress UspA family protein
VLTGVALGAVDLARIVVSFGGLAVFAVLMLTLGRWLLDAVSKQLLARGGGTPAALTIVLVAALGGAAVTQALHVEAILGAYLVGLALSLGRYQMPQVRSLLETITAAFFAPVFFAYSGLRVDITLLGDPEVALVTVAAVSLAVASKVIGSIIGGRLAGLSGPVSRVLGVGLTPLGVMGVVVAIIAFTAGVFDETLYTILVLAAVFTSIMAPVILSLVVGQLPAAPEEVARLEWESLLDESQILRSTRILLPTRGGASTEYAALLVARVFDHAEVTVLVIDVPRPRGLRWWRRSGSAPDPGAVIAAFGDKPLRVIRRVAKDPADEIARESRLGYGLIVMGASEPEPLGALTATVVDRVMTRTEIPVIVAHTPDGTGEGPVMPEHILVPVTASRSARAAEEFAYSVARTAGSRVTAIHVINRADESGHGERPWLSDSTEVGEALARSAREFGERVGVDVNTEIKRASSAEQEIMDYVRNSGADLLVLGASARPLSHRPFLGHRVGFMIDHAAIPVVVIALPSPR